MKIENKALGDAYYELKHPTGLTVLVYPKAGYSTTYAIIGTSYGSIDTFLQQPGKAAKPIVAGTAHYLEHKLFESEELDAFARFAATGASANAYTSFDKTCYLFTCSDNVDENLEILLDFVQHPYFTEETVQKEQGIIGQEIQMYQDEPSWKVLFNLLECLYVNHPVKIDIAGTVESISHITADLLYDCYRNFYNLNNMVLAVAGNVTPEQVMAICDKCLTETEGEKPVRADYNEPASIVKPYTEEKFPIQMPSFCLGFKETHKTPRRSLKEQVITSILLDYIAGDTSPLYNKLLADGRLNGNFGYEYFNGYGYASVIFAGDTKFPLEVAEEIRAEVRRVKAEGLDPEEFERLRKVNYGRAVMGYNDISSLANELITSHFEGYRLFEELEIYKSLTLEEANAQLQTQLEEDCSALSVILPRKQA